MLALLIAVSTVVCCLALLQSLFLTWQQLENCRFARSRMRPSEPQACPGHVAVIVPCRGAEHGLADHLDRLFQQDYPDYELIFVVGSEQDPAWQVIREVMARHPERPAKIVVAGAAVDCGQKVHNLCVATETLDPNIAFLAFADSDARPRPDWLWRLVYRLERDDVGAVTGYRWFVPASPRLPDLLLSSINGMAASLLGPGGHFLIWGGSWAIRRQRFDELQIRRAWQGTLNDDLVATGVVRRAGLRVEFEPRCLVASVADHTLGEVFEFARRQYLTGRLYSRRWWTLGLAATTVGTLGYWLGMLAAALAVLTRPTGWMWPIAAFNALWIVNTARAWLRQRQGRICLPEVKHQLGGVWWFDLSANLMAGTFNWVALASSAFGNSMVWRGIRYEILAPHRIRIVEQSAPAIEPGAHPGPPAPHFGTNAESPANVGTMLGTRVSGPRRS